MDRGIQITKETNLNSVYQHLIGGVFRRPWAEGQHPVLQGIEDEHQFFTVLEEIAAAIWQGSGRAATRSEILARCQSGTLEQSFRSLELAAQEGVTRLLTAFYFRRAESVQGTEPSFEFSHKSFGEYLVARRLVRQVKITADERAWRQSKGNDWSKEESLRHWIKLCGPKALDHDLFRFVEREIALTHSTGPQEVKQWQQMLDELLEWELRSGMPMQVVSGPKTFKEQTLWARNAEETLFILGYVCACNTRELRHISWPEKTSLGALVKRLQGQREASENPLVLTCLGFLDAKRQYLHMGDFFQAKFINTDLSGSGLNFACLIDADLGGANLTDTNLTGADLRRADLRGAKLQNTNFQGANVQNIKLQQTEFRGLNVLPKHFVSNI